MKDGAKRLLDGLRDALDGNMHRATFIGVDFGDKDMGDVYCPKCKMVSSWSCPDTPPENCWCCGIEFRYRRSEGSHS